MLGAVGNPPKKKISFMQCMSPSTYSPHGMDKPKVETGREEKVKIS